jgi:hypothetical protein
MLDGFEADAGELQAAGSRLSGVASSIKSLDVAGPFRPVSDALPGSRTGPASIWVSSRLAAAALVYSDAVSELGSAATASATAYRSADQSAAATLGGLGR